MVAEYAIQLRINYLFGEGSECSPQIRQPLGGQGFKVDIDAGNPDFLMIKINPSTCAHKGTLPRE